MPKVAAATRAGALDPEGREALLRCLLRPPVAQERLELRPDGLVRIVLKKAYTDGAVAVDMDPLSLLCVGPGRGRRGAIRERIERPRPTRPDGAVRIGDLLGRLPKIRDADAGLHTVQVDGNGRRGRTRTWNARAPRQELGYEGDGAGIRRRASCSGSW